MSLLNGTTPILDSLTTLATLDPASLPPHLAARVASVLAQYQQLCENAGQITTAAAQITTAQQQLTSSHQETLAAWNGLRVLPKPHSTALRGYAEAVRAMIDQLEDLALRADGLAQLTEETSA